VLPESLSCVDEEEKEEGSSSFERLRSADTTTKGRQCCVLCKKRTIWKCARCDVALCLGHISCTETASVSGIGAGSHMVKSSWFESFGMLIYLLVFSL